jgi:HEAT repeat protein
VPDFAAVSEPGVRAATGLVVGAGAVVAACIGLLLLARLVRHLRDRRRAAVVAVWRPRLLASLVSPPAALPVVSPVDAGDVLWTWISLHASLRGEVKERLNEAARRAGLDRLAQRMLGSRNRRDRLIAIAALGHLRERAAWQDLRAICLVRHPVESLTAAHALLRIDAEQGLADVVPLIAIREDWPPARVATLLVEAGADAIADLLTRAALEAPPERAVQLVRYFVLARSAATAPAVHRLLQSTRDPELVRAGLDVLRDAADVEIARRFLEHESWIVRTAAARAVGRLGSAGDAPRLVPLVGDRAWWVRYRACQALASLPGIGVNELRRIAAGTADPFARDMIAHVIAERRLA